MCTAPCLLQQSLLFLPICTQSLPPRSSLAALHQGSGSTWTLLIYPIKYINIQIDTHIYIYIYIYTTSIYSSYIYINNLYIHIYIYMHIWWYRKGCKSSRYSITLNASEAQDLRHAWRHHVCFSNHYCFCRHAHSRCLRDHLWLLWPPGVQQHLNPIDLSY